MPRIPRMYLYTEYFHVITQGINKSYIFEESVDIKYYIKKMYELNKKYNIKIISYCVMNNHTHFLLHTEEIKNLSNYMHDLNTAYACYYNKKYKRKGYVFRDRYKSEGIYSESHLYNCINYIYNNPVKAGICIKPEEYPYSNYKKIENKNIDDVYMFMDVDEDEKNAGKIISDFLIEHKYSLKELVNDRKELYRLILILKRDYGVSLRKISDLINVNREKVRKIYNNK